MVVVQTGDADARAGTADQVAFKAVVAGAGAEDEVAGVAEGGGEEIDGAAGAAHGGDVIGIDGTFGDVFLEELSDGVAEGRRPVHPIVGEIGGGNGRDIVQRVADER